MSLFGFENELLKAMTKQPYRVSRATSESWHSPPTDGIPFSSASPHSRSFATSSVENHQWLYFSCNGDHSSPVSYQRLFLLAYAIIFPFGFFTCVLTLRVIREACFPRHSATFLCFLFSPYLVCLIRNTCHVMGVRMLCCLWLSLGI